MKKNYIYPQVIVTPCYGVNALCISGETSTDFNVTDDHGGIPWDDGRAPKRTIFY